MRCPHECDTEEFPYPLYAHPRSFLALQNRLAEVPAYVNELGGLTDTYTDGVVGITEEEKEYWASIEDMPYCVVCHSEAIS